MARATRVRGAEVTLWTARPLTDPAGDPAKGEELTIAISAKEPSRAYVLRTDPHTGAVVCDCFTARWRGTCPHVEAYAVYAVYADSRRKESEP